MIYTIDHLTRVRYDMLVRMARFNLRLEPQPWPGQTISDFSLTVTPAPTDLARQTGAFPVNLSRVMIDGPLDELEVRSRFVAEVEDGGLGLTAPDLPVTEVAQAALKANDLGPWSPSNYLFASPLLPRVPAIEEWARPLLPPDAPTLEAGLALARTIKRDFVYDSAATEADTPVSEAFGIRRGVCQDFTHILIAALRCVGLPAAYASGYLRTLPPPGKPRLVGVDAMHAWAALWCGPQRGWVGLDPTNGCLAGTDHIFVALGRDYADVAPIDGVFVGGGAQHIDTSVDVVPMGE